jgi:GST-like protein
MSMSFERIGPRANGTEGRRRGPSPATDRPPPARLTRGAGLANVRDSARRRPIRRIHASERGRIVSENEEEQLPNQPEGYEPPRVWSWDNQSGGRFTKINRPIAGPTHDKELPVGEHPFQLYSLATPNGVKVTVMFEELLALGHTGAEYDAWLINIGEGDQFGSGFVEINPNSKIPALMDRSGPEPIRLFESGAMLVHLAERFGAFLPTDTAARAETLSWLFWQMGSAPYLGGGFGHFYAYAPFKMQYAIDRFAMEAKRQLDVLDRNLADRRFLTGDDYTIADMAVCPWYGTLVTGSIYSAQEFLSVHEYTNLKRWAEEVQARPAYRRGARVNRVWGDEATQVPERHSAADLDPK